MPCPRALLLSAPVSNTAAQRQRRSRLCEVKDAAAWEQKRLPKPFAVQITDEKGTFEGHGAVFNRPHPTSSWMLDWDWQDVIAPGAFTKTLAEHNKLGVKPPLLYMHERGNVCGALSLLEEDQDGLKVAGQVSLSAKVPCGATIYELMRMAGLTGLSIGFNATKVELDEDTKVRTILELQLNEQSIVDIPGGPAARISDVKSGDPRLKQALETALRDAGLSRREAKALLADGFDALRDAAVRDELEQRDAATATEDMAKQGNELARRIRALAAGIRS